ncbi:YheC/YheD family protein [Cohnella panacarvi]|uniref:YheC/YheD family protein n=1 Tax=Cohnella panacarvi TaxID=400776 RepID=UPI00047DB982|nr:YheC/YheD family protein [Cohnella panacarvi]
MPRKSRSLSVKSKWTKTKWLLSDRAVRRFVPETKLFSRTSLQKMTRRYRMVYFKPTGGTGGNGIARIVRISSGRFNVRKDWRTTKATSVGSLYVRLKRIARGRSYLLQRGVHLRSSGGRPFDIRVTLQKARKGRWVPTVMFVKLGKPGKVVTNYHSGGKLALLGPTLRRAGFGESRIGGYKRQLKLLGLHTARCFNRRSSRFKELGLDVAIDRGGRLWILEVNTRPGISALKSLRDKSLYRTMMKYARSYGRMR